MNKILFLFLILFPTLLNAQTTNYFGTNVGIGSINPGTALDVQGTVKMNTVLINGYTEFIGTPVSFNTNTIQQATTDLWFQCYDNPGIIQSVRTYIGTSNPPTTNVCIMTTVNTSESGECTGMVPKNYYYEGVDTVNTVASCTYYPIGK
jgi:hypothetical protein